MMRPDPEPELVESNGQFIGAWKMFAGRARRGEVVELPGLVAAFGRDRLTFFNAMFLSEPVRSKTDLEGRARAAVGYATSTGRGWFFAVCDDWLPPDVLAASQDVFATHGLFTGMNWTGMVADALDPPAHPTGDLECRPVADAETRQAVSDINCICYKVPLDWGREVIDREPFWNRGVFGSVGHVGSMPVTTATTLAVDGRLYVAMVATLPDYRRRGYAETVMRHSLAQAHAATGLTRTVLHATDIGLPVYRKMGYRPVTLFTMYAPRHM